MAEVAVLVLMAVWALMVTWLALGARRARRERRRPGYIDVTISRPRGEVDRNGR